MIKVKGKLKVRKEEEGSLQGMIVGSIGATTVAEIKKVVGEEFFELIAVVNNDRVEIQLVCNGERYRFDYADRISSSYKIEPAFCLSFLLWLCIVSRFQSCSMC